MNNKKTPIWSVLSKSVTVGSLDNLLSVFNIIEEIQVDLDKSKLPVEARGKNVNKFGLGIDLVLTVLWEREVNDLIEESLEYKLKFVDPLGVELISQEIKEIFPSKKRRKRMMHNMNSLVFSEASGRYYFKILSMKGEELMSTPVDVKVTIKD